MGELVSGLWEGGQEVVLVVVEVVSEDEGSRERWYGCDKWVHMKCMFDEQLVISYWSERSELSTQDIN